MLHSSEAASPHTCLQLTALSCPGVAGFAKQRKDHEQQASCDAYLRGPHSHLGCPRLSLHSNQAAEHGVCTVQLAAGKCSIVPVQQICCFWAMLFCVPGPKGLAWSLPRREAASQEGEL